MKSLWVRNIVSGDSRRERILACEGPIIRAIVLIGICVLIAISPFQAAISAEPHSESAKISTETEAPAKFRSAADDYSRQISGSLGFVLLVALGGFAAVKFMKRSSSFIGKMEAGKDYDARLLSFKRIAPRLNILVVDVGHGKIVTLADNGNSLLKLAEFEQSVGVQTVQSHGINHEA